MTQENNPINNPINNPKIQDTILQNSNSTASNSNNSSPTHPHQNLNANPDFILTNNQPAEWVNHESCWLAWPARADLWEDNLKPAQQEFIQLCNAILDYDSKDQKYRGESLNIIALNPESVKQVKEIFKNKPVQVYQMTYGDIWLRDSAPIFIQNLESKQITNIMFGFNGWGEKYILEGDDQLSFEIAKVCQNEKNQKALDRRSFILEGGSIDTDGLGTFLTTDQCLLNPNRNPNMNREQIEAELKILGANKVIWIKEGLINDHTDGHIDTIARFVAPGEVVCMRAENPETDPNAKILKSIEEELRSATDINGHKLKVHTIPSPGCVLDDEGEIMPASYVNFYISNTSVIVPTYGVQYDEQAIKELQNIFKDRKVIGLSAKAILSGGGAFHCITQQVPK